MVTILSVCERRLVEPIGKRQTNIERLRKAQSAFVHHLLCSQRTPPTTSPRNQHNRTALRGEQLGLTQPKVSALRHYKLSGFSIERLMNLLTALDQDVAA